MLQEKLDEIKDKDKKRYEQLRHTHVALLEQLQKQNIGHIQSAADSYDMFLEEIESLAMTSVAQ